MGVDHHVHGQVTSEVESYPSRRWLVLGVTWLAFFAFSMAWYVMPTLQAPIRQLYGISGEQFQLALTIPWLVAAVLAIPGGILADRLGIREAVSIGLGIASVGFLLRSITGGFLTLLGPMLLVGVGLGLTLPNLPKLVSVWFPPAEAGLATGIYDTGLFAGLSTGLIVATSLPGWREGNLLLGGVALALALVFFAVVRDAPPGVELPSMPLLQGASRALRSQNTWIASLALFAALAGMVSLQGELPYGLLEVYGISPAAGGQITSMITYGSIVGSLTIPTVADRLDRRKATLLVVAVGFGVVEYPVWLSGDPTLLLVGTALAGFLAGGALPIIMEVPTWLPRIDDDPIEQEDVGGASGLMTSFMGLGGFVGLPFVVGPIIGSRGYTVGFAVAMVVFAIQGILGLFLALPHDGA